MFLKFNTIESRSRRNPAVLLVFALWAAVPFAFWSCNGNKKQKKKPQPVEHSYIKPLPEDTLMTRVTILDDTSQSYAVFIPRKKDAGGVLPVVFFFDAHARGALPVKRYRALAEQYGFILAGSNNSKNGLQKSERNRILYKFMEDVEKRSPFDPNRIYVSGFSGGARIASGIGLSNKNIAGVIACAAGFPDQRYKPEKNFLFISIAGNKDFNHLELETLYRQLTALGIKNVFLTFDGKHDWPPETVMEQAFQLLQLDAMQKTLIPTDKKLTERFRKRTEKEIGTALANRDILTAYRACKKEMRFLEGLTPLDKCRKRLENMENNPAFNTARYHRQQMLTLEQNRQKELLRAMEVKDSTWWKKELQKIKHNTVAQKNGELRLINHRLLSYLSLISYLYAKQALAQNNVPETAKFLMIYRGSDPDNPEVYFMLAEYYALQGNVAKVLPMLNKAVEKGFKEPGRIKTSRYFRTFHDNPSFNKIIEAAREAEKRAEG